MFYCLVYTVFIASCLVVVSCRKHENNFLQSVACTEKLCMEFLSYLV